jgi:hypothetical protein
LRLCRVPGWFYSFEINNWHRLSKIKNATMERAGKGFLRLLSGRKKGAFFGKEYCIKCTEKSNAGRKSRKGLIA